MMTPEERADLRRLAEEATPGPWSSAEEWLQAAGGDASYLAACSPERILALLGKVDRLEAELEEAREEVAGCDRHDPDDLPWIHETRKAMGLYD